MYNKIKQGTSAVAVKKSALKNLWLRQPAIGTGLIGYARKAAIVEIGDITNLNNQTIL